MEKGKDGRGAGQAGGSEGNRAAEREAARGQGDSGETEESRAEEEVQGPSRREQRGL